MRLLGVRQAKENPEGRIMKAENIYIERRSLAIAVVDVDRLARRWPLVLVRGIAAVAFGAITLVAPDISLTALVLLFGAYAFVDGALAIASVIRRRGAADRWWLLWLKGLAGITVGVVTALSPQISALALLYVIAAWALVTGGFELAAAIRLRKVIRHEWLLALTGIASIALGVLLVLFPGPGALALVIWIGVYALIAGALATALAFRLRSWTRSRAMPAENRPATARA
jgi:uncharacterized membrane protein HdeD (DUF308 family)